MSPRVRLQRLGLFTLFCFAITWTAVVFAAPDNVFLWRFADSGTYYRAGHDFLKGTDLYAGTIFWQWPLVAALCAPISLLPPMLAGRVFALLSGVGAVLGYWGLWRRLSANGSPPQNNWFFLVAVGTPTLVLIYTGQMTGLSFGAYGVGLMLMDRHPRAAGISFAFMAAKPHLALLALPALLAAAPATIVAFAVGVFFWPVGSLLVAGPDALWNYGVQLLRARDLSNGLVAISLSSLLPVKGNILRLLQSTCALLYGAWLARLLYRRVRYGQIAGPESVDVTTAAGLAALPYALDYDLPFAAAALIRLGESRSSWRTLLMTGWWLLPILASALVGFGGGGIGAVLPPAIAIACARTGGLVWPGKCGGLLRITKRMDPNTWRA